MNATKSLLGIPILCMGFASCYYGSDTVSTETLVVTQYDTDADFSQFLTFAVSDTIGLITDDSDVTEPVYGTDAQQIVSQVVGNLEQRGYSRVGVGNDPDLAVNILAIKDLYIETFYPGYWWGYPGYWWGYPDYWGYPDWSYYYPWYGSYTYYYETGSLIIEVIDMEHPDSTGNKFEVVWTVYIRGILDDSDTYTTQKMLNSIDEAFAQSPYLRNN